MKSLIEKFKVTENLTFSLKEEDAGLTYGVTKEEGVRLLNEYKNELKGLQEKLYVDGRYALLIIFQAMDAGGKDSAIEHIMSGVNPQGCQVTSFKQPSVDELKHDFLWRVHKVTPERGIIGIFNRSHYESVLVCKVHPELVLNERIAGYTELEKIDEKFWQERYRSIRGFEEHLTQNGTVILKFFLHISKEEQKERFLKRIDNPDKNWKFSAGDIEERKRWNDYMRAYKQAIAETSSEAAPWFVIPSDKKWFSRLSIIRIIAETLKSLDLKNPELNPEEKEKLQESKKALLEEGQGI